MIPWAESTRVFPVQALYALEAARAIVQYIPESPDLRCHEVARIVGHFVDALAIDGKYGMAEHSWLVNRGWRNPRIVLDVYAVGQLPQVILVDTLPSFSKLYKWDEGPRTDIREDLVQKSIAAIESWFEPAGYEHQGVFPSAIHVGMSRYLVNRTDGAYSPEELGGGPAWWAEIQKRRSK